MLLDYLVSNGWKLAGLALSLSVGAPLTGFLTARREQTRHRTFEELLDECGGQLYRTAYRLTGNRDDAQDLVQETAMDALRSFHQFRQGTQFNRWISRILTFNFIDRYRVKQRTHEESLEELTAAGVPQTREVADQRFEPARCLESGHLEEPIQKALDALPVEYRIAVVLRDIEDYSYEDIGRLLSLPPGTVRSRIKRGRDRLRISLADYVRDRFRL